MPATMKDIRAVLASLDWETLVQQVEREAQTQMAIVGSINVGKSTLFNALKGAEISPVSSVPGTTRRPVKERLGPFLLVDTPGFDELDSLDSVRIALRDVETSDLFLLLLDGEAGLRRTDLVLHNELRTSGRPVMVVLNKVDLLNRAALSDILACVEDRLGPGVIPISAKKEAGLVDRLFPRIIEAHPALAVSLGRALPAYRCQAARRLMRNASTFNALVGTEPVPGLDLPLLLSIQVRLVLRLAAVYGRSMTARSAKELISTIAGGMAFRYLAAEVAKLLPGVGWAVSGALAAFGTWTIGQVAIRYFDSERSLTPHRMKKLYRRLVRWRGVQDA
ncbi:MAG: GTP-binding protein [Anaerolineae bacterium]|nr:MAG: GTP-binding protein [Anaerolineae bacterium]